MPTKKKRTGRKTQAAVPARVKALAAVLIVVLVAGVAAVKYFQRPAGRVVLLDRGFDSYYTQVRDDIGNALAAALDRFDLRDAVVETVERDRHGSHAYRRFVWDIRAPRDTDLLMVNVALTEAIHGIGAYIRRAEEPRAGALVFHAGTQNYETHTVTIRKDGAAPTPPKPAPLPSPERTRTAGSRLAVVIDDFGYHRGEVVRGMLELDFPVTISILPSLPHSRFVLERAKALDRCVLVHLPMEANEPYPTDLTVITVDMGSHEIERVVERYLQSLPGAVGLNNHQGSLATTDARVMAAVLDVVGRHGMFFLDSLTSPKSVAYNTARKLGVPAARNSVFLDDDTEDAGIVEERLRRAVALAKKHGTAVAIGHPHEWTLEALRSSEDFLRGALELVYLADVVE